MNEADNAILRVWKHRLIVLKFAEDINYLAFKCVNIFDNNELMKSFAEDLTDEIR